MLTTYVNESLLMQLTQVLTEEYKLKHFESIQNMEVLYVLKYINSISLVFGNVGKFYAMHFRSNAGGKRRFKTKKNVKIQSAPRAFGLFRWAQFFCIANR